MNGALLLMRQYLKEGWHPTGTPDSGHRITRASSALLRALAVTASDSNVEPESVPNRQSGWGRLNLSGMMHFAGDSLALEFADESLGLATGEVYEYRFNVERRVPMTVSLAWTDTAAAPAASRAIVNDLNLELQSPDGNRFRGNQFYMGQSAVNPPYWDSVNVEEVCRLRLPLAGPWTLRVYGRNVFTARQPFALVVRSGTATPLPGIEEAAFEPGRSRTTIVSSWPLRLSPGRTEQLAVYGADGRLVTRTHVAGSWDGRDNRGCRLAPGVYCFVLGDAGGRAHRLVVLR
jgi:hypothetical protein